MIVSANVDMAVNVRGGNTVDLTRRSHHLVGDMEYEQIQNEASTELDTR